MFKKENTANAEELLDAIEEGVRKFVRTTLEVYAKDEFLRYIGLGLMSALKKEKIIEMAVYIKPS